MKENQLLRETTTNILPIEKQTPQSTNFGNKADETNKVSEVDNVNEVEANEINEAIEANEITIEYAQQCNYARFELSSFEEFINLYKATYRLASEVLDALNHFLLALHEFLNLCEDLINVNLQNRMIFVDWYNSA
ncbi:5652_t:CDS:2, partial [Racocetra persica]